MSRISEMATSLHIAQRQQSPIAQFSTTETFNLNQAYEIQHQLIGKRVAEGEHHIGIKMGFTSEAKMAQMGVSEMIIGQLTDKMECINGGSIKRTDFIHPRVEPEIAFRLKKDITEPIAIGDVLNYVDGVSAALEVIDSRYENFKFSLEDVIADNCSSAAFVLGNFHEPRQVLTDLEMALLINGKPIETGNSNDILGNPWKSLVAASELSYKYNLPLKAGNIVLAGAATSAHFINVSDEIAADVAELQSVFFRVV